MLLTEEPKVSFDLSAVRRGDLLWGKHRTWDEGKAGFVSAVTGNRLIVQYHPGIGNVTNHFMIPAAEAAAGEWEVRWSSDLLEVFHFSGTEEPDPDESDLPEDPEGADVPEENGNLGETESQGQEGGGIGVP